MSFIHRFFKLWPLLDNVFTALKTRGGVKHVHAAMLVFRAKPEVGKQNYIGKKKNERKNIHTPLAPFAASL